MGAPIYQMGNMGSSVNSEETAKPGTIEAANKKSDKEKAAKAAEKKRLNTKTKDTEAKTVKQGRLSRKEAVKTAKNAAKSKRDAKLDKPNMDLEGAVGKRKEARATKRQEMQDIRNEERGARRADRADRRIKRIGDRNNMTVGEATKVYSDRQEAFKGYAVGERGPNPANVDKQKNVDDKNEQLIKDNFNAEEQGQVDAFSSVNGIANEENSPQILMLDKPSQQAASEDSSGMGTYMLDSKNRRGR
tara:strand:- start:19 stop:756 length:738 start_codon:yes stop_codon:yes gene_type:complete